ncbi:MAG: DUF2066 domain-containing protein [Gammaproteobacteria bacterium]
MKDIVHRNFDQYGRSLLVLLLPVVLLVGPVSSHGARFEDLYTVVVPADTEAENPLEVATERALGELFVRITGQRSVGGDPAVYPILEAADRFVEQWGYQTAEDIVVTFDGVAVEAELRRLNLPIWGTERPLTMVWIAYDPGNGRRQLLGAQPDESEDVPDPLAWLREMVEVTAAERGIPTVLPLLDAEDSAALAVADVWGGFTDRIEAASRRYGADAVLLGRVRSSGGANAARWSLLTGEDFRERRGTVRDGIDWLADTYARQYAVTGSASRRRVLVSEVNNFDDYARVVAFMEQLSLIESLAVEEVVDDTVLLSMNIRGDALVLQRALSLGSVLQPVPPPFATPVVRVADAYFRVAH